MTRWSNSKGAGAGWSCLLSFGRPAAYAAPSQTGRPRHRLKTITAGCASPPTPETRLALPEDLWVSHPFKAKIRVSSTLPSEKDGRCRRPALGPMERRGIAARAPLLPLDGGTGLPPWRPYHFVQKPIPENDRQADKGNPLLVSQLPCLYHSQRPTVPDPPEDPFYEALRVPGHFEYRTSMAGYRILSIGPSRHT